MSFKTALATDFKRVYKNTEFLGKQRPGVEEMIPLPPNTSQLPGQTFVFFVTKATERHLENPESLVLALT